MYLSVEFLTILTMIPGTLISAGGIKIEQFRVLGGLCVLANVRNSKLLITKNGFLSILQNSNCRYT